jgi:hypothetical protein
MKQTGTLIVRAHGYVDLLKMIGTLVVSALSGHTFTADLQHSSPEIPDRGNCGSVATACTLHSTQPV